MSDRRSVRLEKSAADCNFRKRAVAFVFTVLLFPAAMAALTACGSTQEQIRAGSAATSAANSVWAGLSESVSATAVSDAAANTTARASVTFRSCPASRTASKGGPQSEDDCGCQAASSSVLQAGSRAKKSTVQSGRNAALSRPVSVCKTIVISGMMCDDCVQCVNEALENVKGVQVENVEIGKAVVEISGKVSDDTLKNAVEKSSNGGASGYTVKSIS